MGFTHHVLRRSIEHPAVTKILKRAAEEAPKLQIPPWGAAVLIATFVAIIVGLSAVEYSLKNVVATLSMVETPSAAITVSNSDEPDTHDKKEGLLETGPSITLVHQKPITTSIRGTIRHLVSIGGRWSRWRGFKLSVLYVVSKIFADVFFHLLLPRFVPGRTIFASAMAGAVCANVHATWTHKVISMPNDKTFRERLVSRSNWKVLALPAAVQASAGHIALFLGKALTVVLGLHHIDHEEASNFSGSEWTVAAFKVVAIIVVCLASALFLVLPANVTLVRTEASILPEDQDTIVPFDRSFGGKVVPKILGGTGAIGFLDAWRSFTWEARGRLIKLYLKIFAIMSVLTFISTHVLVFEAWAIMGPAITKFIREMQQRQGQY